MNLLLVPLLGPCVAALVAAQLIFTSASAAEPMLEKVDLFEAGQDGFSLYRIPGIVVTPKGTVLAYCEARKDSSADWGEIEVHIRRSTDGGKNWEASRKIAHLGERPSRDRFPHARKPKTATELTVNNPVAIVDRESGSVHLLYCIEYALCYYIRSDDDGQTWSQPVEITATFDKFRPEYPWNVLATGPGHGIQLQKGKHKGRLIVPVWLCSGKGGAHRPSVVATVFSDDHGKTWQRGEIAVPNTEEWKNPNETVIVELADGRVMLNSRNESKANRRLVTISADGATGWSTPRFDQALFDPICMGSIVRLSEKPTAGKNRIIFANPHSLKVDAEGKPVPGASGERKNLSLKLSYDEGETWPVNKTLEAGSSAYSDLAVLPDGTVLCFYERSKKLTVARLNLEWLTDGKDATEDSKKAPAQSR